MNETVHQCQERIERAVSRFIHHANGEGMDVADLNGTISIALEDGKVTGTGFEPAAPKPKRGSKKGELSNPDDQPFEHG